MADGEFKPLGGREQIPRAEKISEAVARVILDHIIGEQLPAGTKLPPESEMAASFGIGRGSLREALRILEIHGVVSIRQGPRGGPVIEVVSSYDFARMASLVLSAKRATFREIMEARLVIDPLMARLAARRRDPSALRDLVAATERARSAATGDEDEWMRSSSDFHTLVAGMSGNRALDLIGRALLEIYRSRLSGQALYKPDAREEARHDHEEIAKAIAAGDGDRAEELMRVHMEEFTALTEGQYPSFMDEPVQWLRPAAG